MKLSHLYQLVIRYGNKYDPRGKTGIKFYEDTGILYGNPKTEIEKVLVGIDIEAAELLLADRIRQRQGLDLVISHHPEGFAYASLYKVMRLQIDVLKQVGLPEAIAKELLENRQREVERKILPNNHSRAVDAARLLNMPFMCIHTPADNHVFSFMKKLMQDEKPKKVRDILEILNTIPEYKAAAVNSAGPRVILGSPNRLAGKILVEMTGGTEGSLEAYGKLYTRGVRTLICMHLSEEHFKKVKDVNLNVVIAGHISSDNLGLNLLLDNIEKEEILQIIDCSGFYRVKRN